MNITIIGPNKKFLSGISYYTIKLANALSEEHEVSVVTIKNLLPKFLFPGKKRVGKKISNLKFNRKTQVCNCLDYYVFPGIFKAVNFLTKRNSDMIIMQWWSSSAALNYLLLKLINRLCFKRKIIIEFHEVLDPLENNIWILRIYVKLVSKILFKNLDAYIVHSNYDRDLVQKAYKLKKESVFVVPHGPYDNYIKETKIKKNKKTFDILFFGLIRNYKGLEYLLEAFNKIPQEFIGNFRLNIVGEIWDNREKIHSMIESSKYRNKIKLINKYVSDEDVNRYFTLADVVVLPYIKVLQSGVVQIAVSYGKPIIISKLNGLKESLEDYKGAFFVEPKNSDQLKDKILECFRKKKISHHYHYNLTWKDVTRRYKKVFTKIK